jgi:hypothetical protein
MHEQCATLLGGPFRPAVLKNMTTHLKPQLSLPVPLLLPKPPAMLLPAGLLLPPTDPGGAWDEEIVPKPGTSDEEAP